ncbi:MAG: fimbria/pilus periplasmic chaperone [Pseudomonadota bacterium]|nr:fimbria/pilus periplasmic chaperone [Pseudomonadota bacterium]
MSAALPGLLRGWCALRFSAVLALLAGVVLPGVAQAASLQISPVMINLRAGQAATGISLQNTGDQPIYGQVRVFLWEQRNGDDVLTPTDELIASPPVMQIAANSAQTIRLVRRSAAAPGPERQFRVLIDEVPTSAEARDGVAIKLQYSVPVFMAAAAPGGEYQLRWTFFKRDGVWMLRVTNSGTLHAQIGATTLITADGRQIDISRSLLGYALAGRQREWRTTVAPGETLGGALTVRANVNTRPIMASGEVVARPEPAN